MKQLKKQRICKYCKAVIKNGRWAYCSDECFESYKILERENNLERKEYIRKYCSDWRKNNNNYHRQWKTKNPNYMREWWINHQGYLSEWMIENDFQGRYKEQIEAGLLAKKFIKIPENYKCELCKIELATQRHHEDYSKPLQVILCCKKCHGLLDEARHIKEEKEIKQCGI